MNRILLAAALALAACSDSNDGSGTSTVNREAALDAASASADETQQAVDAIAGTASALNPAGLRAGMMAFGIPSREPCATASSTTDTDGDGTVDDATYTFALPACALSAFRGGNLELTGAIRVSDPDPSPGYAYRLEYQDLDWNMVMPDTTLSFATTRNGSRQLALENGALVLQSTLTMRRTFGTRGDGDVDSDIRSVFTPAAGSNLTFTLPMPDGTIEQTGTVTFMRNGASRTFDVRTVTPLHVEPTCAAFPRISQGEVWYVAPDSSHVSVTWPGCGLAPVVRSTDAG